MNEACRQSNDSVMVLFAPSALQLMELSSSQLPSQLNVFDKILGVRALSQAR